jgi:hypothetical protein
MNQRSCRVGSRPARIQGLPASYISQYGDYPHWRLSLLSSVVFSVGPLRGYITRPTEFWRRRYELSKQLQDLHIDVALLSETHLKQHSRFFIPNHHFHQTESFSGRKGIPHAICAIRTLDKGEACSQETNPSSPQRECYIRIMTARVQLQKLWSWPSRGLSLRWTDWR